jgi:hypothetical protein
MGMYAPVIEVTNYAHKRSARSGKAGQNKCDAADGLSLKILFPDARLRAGTFSEFLFVFVLLLSYGLLFGCGYFF